jgi:hypothetical protein
VSEPDFDHFRNVVRAVFDHVRARFAPAIAAAVAAHYEEGTGITDSPLLEADRPDALVGAAERIIDALDHVAGEDAETRRKCLEIVREMAEARVAD